MAPVNVHETFTTDLFLTQPFYWAENTMTLPIDIGIRPEFAPKSDPFVEFLHQTADFGMFGHVEQEDVEDESEEPMQICNLNESVLRLEEMAQKKEMTFKLSNDGVKGLHDLYQELFELNSRASVSSEGQMTPCQFMGRRFSGLKSEDVDRLDERKLLQLLYEFGLEKVENLPVLQMDALNNFL